MRKLIDYVAVAYMIAVILMATAVYIVLAIIGGTCRRINNWIDKEIFGIADMIGKRMGWESD